MITTMNVHDFDVKTRTGESVKLDQYRGKALLIVNTASKCKLTPQFEGLEQLNQDYKDRGLQVLGFPCNQFAKQDPEDNDTILTYCQRNYGVSFPVYAKLQVNGKNAHPLYKYLKSKARGLLWSQRVKWNFTKFLVSPSGEVLRRYAPTTKPEKLIADIEEVIGIT